MVGHRDHLRVADKVCSAPLRKLTWPVRDWCSRGEMEDPLLGVGGMVATSCRLKFQIQPSNGRGMMGLAGPVYAMVVTPQLLPYCAL
jgi:hypothetical protein